MLFFLYELKGDDLTSECFCECLLATFFGTAEFKTILYVFPLSETWYLTRLRVNPKKFCLENTPFSVVGKNIWKLCCFEVITRVSGDEM